MAGALPVPFDPTTTLPDSQMGVAPLSGQTAPYWQGVADRAVSAIAGSYPASVVAQAWPGDANNVQVQPDDAKKEFIQKGLDPSVLPKGPIYRSALDAIAVQQNIVNNANDSARRSSSAGGVVQGAANLAGGFLGYTPLAFVPGIGELGAGTGLVARAGIGAVEGGVTMGGMTEAQKQFGTAPGDRDITSNEVLNQTAIGSVIGGGARAYFRPTRLDQTTVAALERSPNAAKLQGVSVNEVTSPKGAVGLYQITPIAARDVMGKDFDVSTLKDPKVNAAVNQKILDKLQGQFPGDLEAQTVAYNGGTSRAERWIKAGRDDRILPDETQKYLARLRGIIGEGTPQYSDPLGRGAQTVMEGSQWPQGATSRVDSGIEVPAPGTGENYSSVQTATDSAQRASEADTLKRLGQMDLPITTAYPGGVSLEVGASLRRFADRQIENPVEQMASLPPEVKSSAALTAITQAGVDSDVNVDGVIKAGLAGRAEGFSESMPKPGSALTRELTPELLARLDSVEAMAPKETPTEAVKGENPELTELKSQANTATQIAEHAHEMAYGSNPRVPFKDVLDREIEAHNTKALSDDDKAIHDMPDLAKAIDVATRCAVVKGIT